MNAVMQELQLHKEALEHCREEIEDLRHFQQKFETLREEWREERDRYERLEEQMNDLTELHQHEIENIKSGVNDMEEKVQYQSEERLLDIKEHLQSLETKVSSMEHQQAQQQYLNIDSLDSTNARAVLMKLLSTLIGFVHLVLLFLGTVMNLLKPFLRTTPRAFISMTVVIVSCSIYYKQDVMLEYYVRFKQQRGLGGGGSASS